MKHREEVAYFFDTYPDEQSCLLFTDGQIFTEKNKPYAESFKRQSGRDYKVVTRAAFEGKAPKKSDDKQSFDKLTKKELTALAEEKGLEIDKKMTKADIIEVLIAAGSGESPETSEEEEYEPVKEQ